MDSKGWFLHNLVERGNKMLDCSFLTPMRIMQIHTDHYQSLFGLPDTWKANDANRRGFLSAEATDSA
jgi:hypothetical protein